VDHARRHLRLGWWSLPAFATLGLVLESLHGFKVRVYLEVSNDTRRLMWMLAHDRTFGVVNVLFGLTLRAAPAMAEPRLSSDRIIVDRGFREPLFACRHPRRYRIVCATR
jgi:hypothetical protein